MASAAAPSKASCATEAWFCSASGSRQACWWGLALTPLGPAALWRILRGPLAFTASSGNLLVALPMLVSNLQAGLPLARARAAGRPQQPCTEEIELARELARIVSLGYSLPTLGQVSMLMVLPFAGWAVNQPLGMAGSARMLITGIPASVADIKPMLRQELLRQGLPLNLLELVYLNGEPREERPGR